MSKFGRTLPALGLGMFLSIAAQGAWQFTIAGWVVFTILVMCYAAELRVSP